MEMRLGGQLLQHVRARSQTTAIDAVLVNQSPGISSGEEVSLPCALHSCMNPSVEVET